MAQVRLSYGATNVDWGPGAGFDEPGILGRHRHRAVNGALHSYDFFTPKKKWKAPVTDMGTTDGPNINTWWENDYTCTFVPDFTNNPGTTYTVKIVNTTRPLWYKSLKSWEDHYSGTVLLEEV